MIDHTGIGVSDVARSAAFYDAVLGALKFRRFMQLPPETGADAVGYGNHFPIFWIDRFHPHSVKQHTAFVARSREQVDGFHAAALGAGGVRTTASPGPRGAPEAASNHRATMPRSCLIPTATISKLFSGFDRFGLARFRPVVYPRHSRSRFWIPQKPSFLRERAGGEQMEFPPHWRRSTAGATCTPDAGNVRRRSDP